MLSVRGADCRSLTGGMEMDSEHCDEQDKSCRSSIARLSARLDR
jgi:hypothetical protein